MQRFAYFVNSLFYCAISFETAPFQREANYIKRASALASVFIGESR
jgi:hypothetical protein